MNEKKNKINQEVDKTLSSLDGVKRVETSPFIFTRVMQHLENEKETVPFTSTWSFKLAMFAVLTLVNGFTLYNGLSGIQASQRAAQLDVVAKEYGLGSIEQSEQYFIFRNKE